MKDFNQLPDFLNVKDVQELFGMGKNQAYDLVNSGVIPIVRFGRRIKISKYDLLEWYEGEKVNNLNNTEELS